MIVLAYLPWLPSFLVQERHSGSEARRIAALAPPTLKLFGKVNAQVLVGSPSVPLSRLPGNVATIVGLAVIAFAAVAALARAARAGPRRLDPGSPIALLLLLALVTPIGIGLASLRPHESFLLPRNLSPSLVPIALVVGYLITSMRRLAAVPAATLLIAVLALGAVIGLEPGNRRTPYRKVAHFIDAHSRPGDPIIQIFFFPDSGPFAKVISINLSHPRQVFTTADANRGWDEGRRGADVFLSVDLPGYYRPLKHLPLYQGPGNRFVRVAERRYEGLSTVIVGEYRYAG